MSGRLKSLCNLLLGEAVASVLYNAVSCRRFCTLILTQSDHSKSGKPEQPGTGLLSSSVYDKFWGTEYVILN